MCQKLCKTRCKLTITIWRKLTNTQMNKCESDYCGKRMCSGCASNYFDSYIKDPSKWPIVCLSCKNVYSLGMSSKYNTKYAPNNYCADYVYSLCFNSTLVSKYQAFLEYPNIKDAAASMKSSACFLFETKPNTLSFNSSIYMPELRMWRIF